MPDLKTCRKKGKFLPPSKAPRRSWWPAAAAGLLTILVCLTVNYRANSGLRREASDNENLNKEVVNLTTENITLQEEIQSLQTDKNVVQREARKFGFEASKEKIPVQTK